MRRRNKAPEIAPQASEVEPDPIEPETSETTSRDEGGQPSEEALAPYVAHAEELIARPWQTENYTPGMRIELLTAISTASRIPLVIDHEELFSNPDKLGHILWALDQDKLPDAMLDALAVAEDMTTEQAARFKDHAAGDWKATRYGTQELPFKEKLTTKHNKSMTASAGAILIWLVLKGEWVYFPAVVSALPDSGESGYKGPLWDSFRAAVRSTTPTSGRATLSKVRTAAAPFMSSRYDELDAKLDARDEQIRQAAEIAQARAAELRQAQQAQQARADEIAAKLADKRALEALEQELFELHQSSEATATATQAAEQEARRAADLVAEIRATPVANEEYVEAA